MVEGVADIIFFFKIKELDSGGAEEGLDGGFDPVAGVLWEGAGQCVGDCGDIVSLPGCLDHLKDFIGGGGEAFKREEEIRTGGVEFGNTESDSGRGPYFAFQQGSALCVSEVIDAEG